MRARLTLTLLSFVGALAVGCTSTTNGTPTIAVTPPGPVNVVNGGAPVGFSAATTNTSDVINWTISPATGAGTLSPSVGRSVFYTPPATAAASPSTTVTLTATVSGVSSSATVTLGTNTITAVTIPSLSAPVTVSYDERDIPYVNCATQLDCFTVQGYLHAHDRLFEMDILRRTAEGKLSEIIGSTELGMDLQFRTLFMTPFSTPTGSATPGQPIGDAMVQALSASSDPDAQQAMAVITAYTNGVNAYITAMQAGDPSAPFPAEYGMLLYPLSPSVVAAWLPRDTLAIARLQQFQLSNTLSDEIDNGLFLSTYALGETPGVDADLNKVNAYIRCQQPVPAFTYPAASSVLRPPVSSKAPALKSSALSALSGGAQGLRELSARLKALKTAFSVPGDRAGSNNWVVKGSKSASGASMVANDPHLSLNYPPLFHLISLNGDGLQVVGGSFPGIPGVLIGRGAHLGWGVTVVEYDVTDVYVETFADASHFAFTPGPGGKAAIIPVPQTINYITASGMQTQSGTVLLSQFHGPIVGQASATQPISMRWTGLEVNRCGPTSNQVCNPFKAFFGLLTAASVADAFVSLAAYDTGAQNFVLADDSGNIGFDPHAFVPQRPWTTNPNLLAWAPLPGNGVAEWGAADGTLWVPDALLPQSINPDAGYLATANAAPTDAYCTQDITVPAPFSLGLGTGSAPAVPYLSFDWDDPTAFRAGRIDERLAGYTADGGKVSESDMESIQTDHVATIAAAFLPLLPLPATATDSYGQAMALMGSWQTDGLNCPTGLQGTDPVASPPDPDAMNAQDSAGCMLFHAFLNRLLVSVFNEPLAAAGLGIDAGKAIKAILFMLTPGLPQSVQSFCAPMTCQQQAQAAMTDAFDQITQQLGPQSNWLWGRYHGMAPQSLVFPLVAGFYNPGPYARPGGAFTVDVGTPSLRTDNVLSFQYGSGSNVRWIAVMDGSTTKDQLPGPQIDGPTYPGTMGLLSEYVVNQYFEFPYGETAVGAATVRTQTFSK
jgi:penicillin G amidase